MLAYLLSGLVFSGALLMLMYGNFIGASVFFVASVWLFNLPRKKWRFPRLKDGDVSADEDGSADRDGGTDGDSSD